MDGTHKRAGRLLERIENAQVVEDIQFVSNGAEEGGHPELLKARQAKIRFRACILTCQRLCTREPAEAVVPTTAWDEERGDPAAGGIVFM